jgi:hypothetical protein
MVFLDPRQFRPFICDISPETLGKACYRGCDLPFAVHLFDELPLLEGPQDSKGDVLGYVERTGKFLEGHLDVLRHAQGKKNRHCVVNNLDRVITLFLFFHSFPLP